MKSFKKYENLKKKNLARTHLGDHAVDEFVLRFEVERLGEVRHGDAQVGQLGAMLVVCSHAKIRHKNLTRENEKP